MPPSFDIELIQMKLDDLVEDIMAMDINMNSRDELQLPLLSILLITNVNA
jgi:hypothetical protein